MTPVPTVLLPSLSVNLWLTSRGISFLRVSVRGVSSPGITISLSVMQEEEEEDEKNVTIRSAACNERLKSSLT